MAQILSAVAGLGWLALALCLPALRRSLQVRGTWITVISGILILGWITLCWGSFAGGSGLMLGLLLLMFHSLQVRHPITRNNKIKPQGPDPVNLPRSQ